MRKVFAVSLIVLAMFVFTGMDVNAQCSMCRAVLNSSNNGHFIRNFNIGVLVLLVPPVSIFCSIFIVLRRYRGVDEVDPGETDGSVYRRKENTD